MSYELGVEAQRSCQSLSTPSSFQIDAIVSHTNLPAAVSLAVFVLKPEVFHILLEFSTLQWSSS